MRTLLTDRRGNPIPIGDRRSSVNKGRSLEKTNLLRFVERRSWNEVIRRARSYPEEVCVIDEQGNTPLHVACRFDPPSPVLRSLGAVASVRNVNGLTPLHVAASHQCNATALKTLVDLGPESLRTLSPRRDRTPMHFACLSFRGLDLDAFETLLDASMQPVSESSSSSRDDGEDDYDEEGDIDEEDDIRTEMEMMDHTPDHNDGVVLTWKDSTGSTPLGLLFCRYRERVKTAICRLNQQGPQDEEDVLLQNDIGQLWGKARLIVARMTEERLQREGSLLLRNPRLQHDDSSLTWAVEHHLLGDCKFRIVHASVGLVGYGCPPELIRLAVAIHPQQVREMDEEGNLPLHIAATALSSGSSSIEGGHFSYTAAAAAGGTTTTSGGGGGGADDDSSVYSLTSFFSSATMNATPHAFDRAIQILLKSYPEAIHIPHGKSGKLPLALAIRSRQRRWDDGIRTLLQAHPTAVHSTQLQQAYPEALALIGGGGRPIAKNTGIPISAISHKTGGGKEGGLRLFQNLYLLSLHSNSAHGGGLGGSNHGIAAAAASAAVSMRLRKNRSLTSGGGTSKGKGSKSGTGNKVTPPPCPRVLTTVFDILRSNPGWLDPQMYRSVND